MPLVAKPVTLSVAVAVQANVDPGTFEVSVTRVVLLPEQIDCVIGEFDTVGRALTTTDVDFVVLPHAEVILTE